MTTALRPLLLIFALLCFAAPSAARVGDATNELTSASASTMTQHSLSLERMYGVKERRTTTTKTIHWTLNDLKDKYALTFSQDSPAKVLQLFWLQLHDTNGTPLSTSPSLHTVTTSLERFLTLELDAVFSPTHTVRDIEARVVNQTALLNSNGTELLTSVDITFEFEPSPHQSILELWVESIMADLTYLVSNITALAVKTNDTELANLHSMHRAVYFSASDWPTNTASGITQPGGSNNQPRSPSNNTSSLSSLFGVIVPVVVAGVLIVAVLVLLSIRSNRRRHRTRLLCFTQEQADKERPSLLLARANLAPRANEDDDDDEADDTYGNRNTDRLLPPVHVLVQADQATKEAMVVEAGLLGAAIPVTTQYGNVKKAPSDSLYPCESDVFADLEAAPTSPRNGGGGASIFSFLTHRSEATMPASNTTSFKQSMQSSSSSTAPSQDNADSVLGATSMQYGASPKNSHTPRSGRSSLYTFQEEDDDDESQDNVNVSEDDLCLIPVVTSPRIPYDEAQDREIVEDFLIDTASMNSEHDDDDDREMEEDFLIDTASMNSDSHLYDDNYIMSPTQASIVVPQLIVPEMQTQVVLVDSKVVVSEEVVGHSPQADLMSGMISPASTVASRATHGTADANVATEVVLQVTEPIATKGWRRLFAPLGSKSSSLEDQGPVRSEVAADKAVHEENVGHVKVGLDSEEKATASAAIKSAEQKSLASSNQVNLQWSNVSSAAMAAAFVDAVHIPDNSPTATAAQQDQGRGRRHTKSTNSDGTQQYQRETMEPNPDWSLEEGTVSSPLSASSPGAHGGFFRRSSRIPEPVLAPVETQISTPPSASKASYNKDSESNISALSIEQNQSSMMPHNDSSINTSHDTFDEKPPSLSKHLINDMVWVRNRKAKKVELDISACDTEMTGPQPALDSNDSMSFDSEPDFHPQSNSDVSIHMQEAPSPRSPSKSTSLRETIVCRECVAPPGKLKIVIHSTKDGPAVHTVKQGSALVGQIFPGDLIISVDTVDTRSYSAEQVMKMMTAKSRLERRITVLHFEHE